MPNEELLGKAFAGLPRDSFVISTKFGLSLPSFQPDLAASSIRKHCTDALARLGMTYIDLFIVCRQSAATPIEETMGALKELMDEGFIKAVGLSEASAAQIRRAHAVCPITAVEMEYSLFSRSIEDEVLPTCRELGICILAYSPLGRGFLSGILQREEISGAGPFMGMDYRATSPRFTPEAWEANAALVRKIAEIATSKGCTTAQLALAWVHAQGDDIFPIPGTTKLARLEENLGALDVKLSVEDLVALDAAVPAAAVVGQRYHAHGWGACHENQPKA
jgi:aryl-alcohol dehydrogenase-like predicted oxidoreductase